MAFTNFNALPTQSGLEIITKIEYLGLKTVVVVTFD